MPFKPNYNQRRSERNRVKQQKREEKQQRREGKGEHKAARDEGFLLFDVVYEDGTLSSNRTVAAAELDPVEGDASAHAVIEAQDRKFAEVSGRPRGPIKSIVRSAAR